MSRGQQLVYLSDVEVLSKLKEYNPVLVDTVNTGELELDLYVIVVNNTPYLVIVRRVSS